jgi:hypothetical protein
MVGACGDDDDSTTVTGPEAELTVVQQAEGLEYTEGAESHVRVTDASTGDEVAETEEQFRRRVELLAVELPPGTYQVESWQRGCVGNCGNLGPPSDECESEVALSDDLEVVITVRPGAGCSIAAVPSGVTFSGGY